VYKQLELISSTIIQINESIKFIEDKKGMVSERLLLTKGPSLFKTIFGKKDKNVFPGRRANNFNDIFTPISRYVTDKKNLLTFFVIGFFVLFWFLIFLKKKLSFDKYRKLNMRIIYGVLGVLNRPFMSSLLISLLFATFLIVDAPHVFITLLYILLVIPVMVILPVITIKKLNIYIYGLGFIYLLTLFLRLSLLNHNASQFLMIGINLITLYGIYKILRNKILKEILYRKTTYYIVKFLFTTFAFTLIVSIFSILSGYYKLGVFLLDGAIWSIYRFFLFYAAYVVFLGFAELLIRSEFLQQFVSIKKNYNKILQWMDSIIYLFIMISLIYDILIIFRVEEPVVNFIVSIWESELNIGQVSISFGNVFTFIITLWVASILSKMISSIFEYDLSKSLKLKRGVPKTISVMLKYAILTIGFMIAVAAAGMELKNLTLVISALGVGIGFGLQDVINNFISGLILLFERPIQHGDTIQVGTLWGKVKKIGIRSSVIVTFEGSEVIVPNGMLISQEVTNWTLSDNKRRLDVEVGVEYGSNLEQVIDILIKCATNHKEVMDDPAPSAWFTGFGDSSINFKLVFWYPSFDGGLTVQSDVALAVDVALKEAGITIPFPQQDVYIKEIKEKLQEKPEILKKAVTKNPLAKNMDKIQEDVRKSSIEKGKSSPPKK
jgi:small-conductance mechanosensitive channel